MPVKNKVGLLSFFNVSYHCELNYGVSLLAKIIDKLLFGIPGPSTFRESSKWIATSFLPLSLQFPDNSKILKGKFITHQEY